MAATDDIKWRTHFTFIWTMENASALLVSPSLKSPVFITQAIENTKWTLNLLTTNQVQLFLKREEDNGPDCIEIKFELSLLAASGSPLVLLTYEQPFKGGSESYHREIHNFFIRETREEFVPNDELTVRCRMLRMGADIAEAETCYARTGLRMDRRSFIWAVRKFSGLQSNQKKTHIVNSTINGSPQLILNLFMSECLNKTYLGIQIDQNFAVKNHKVCSKFSLLDTDGRSVTTHKISSCINPEETKVGTIQFFFEKNRVFMQKNSLLQNDVLTLRCEFQLEVNPEWSRIENYRYLNVENLESIEEELKQMPLGNSCESFVSCCPFKKAFGDLYENKNLSDVCLRAGGKSFRAHKNVLSVRSPVFEAMFTQDMKEKTSKIVDISDLNADTLRRLLLYIYKDVLEDLQYQSAMDLFRASDKYQLLVLRKKCSLFLKSELSFTNVCSVLLLADMHGDNDLRNAAEDFISRHDSEIFQSDEWKNFKRENSLLALEIMEQVIHLIKQK